MACQPLIRERRDAAHLTQDGDWPGLRPVTAIGSSKKAPCHVLPSSLRGFNLQPGRTKKTTQRLLDWCSLWHASSTQARRHTLAGRQQTCSGACFGIHHRGAGRRGVLMQRRTRHALRPCCPDPKWPRKKGKEAWTIMGKNKQKFCRAQRSGCSPAEVLQM